ncbi:MAG: hypothetical protein P4L40_02175 [Terracidiphilus sp.]|nr:hypothetical protein [Terracidiphilus sp.]
MGVGFSYSNTPSDYNTDNNITASDNLVALNLFLARFPAFQGRPLWLSGESYAGDYGVCVCVNDGVVWRVCLWHALVCVWCGVVYVCVCVWWCGVCVCVCVCVCLCGWPALTPGV